MVGELVVLLVERLARPFGQPITEDGAEQMVGLVLEAARQQTGAGELDGLAVLVDAADVRLVGPRALDIGTGQRQAALVGRLELTILALGE